MPISIRRCRDLKLVHSLHQETFPHDEWEPQAGVAHWVAWDGDYPIGFCSAKVVQGDTLYLTRAGVLKSHRGLGLQRRLVSHRVRYARKQGCVAAITYTTQDNFPSITNLILSGFRFYTPAEPWVGDEFFYFRILL